MISYRHHVVSLVAVFLALAVGVVLGGGPLSELGRDRDTATARQASAETGPIAQAGYGEAFATATAARLYDDALAERPVALLALPGADEDTLTALSDQVQVAGGEVAARYELQARLTDPTSSTLVDSLGTQVLEQLGDAPAARGIDPEAPAYVRLGQLTGLAVGSSSEAGGEVTDAGRTVRDSLSEAGLVTSPEPDAALAPLLVVVLGDDQQVDPDVLQDLLSGLSATTQGVVLAGPTSSGADGVLATLREDGGVEGVPSVDGVETAPGQVTTLLALLRAPSGAGGDFGVAGADGAVPVD